MEQARRSFNEETPPPFDLDGHGARPPKRATSSPQGARAHPHRTDWFAATLAECIPTLRHRAPEATYLAWLDGRGLGLNVSPTEHFLDQVASHSPTGPRWRCRQRLLPRQVGDVALDPGADRRTDGQLLAAGKGPLAREAVTA